MTTFNPADLPLAMSGSPEAIRAAADFVREAHARQQAALRRRETMRRQDMIEFAYMRDWTRSKLTPAQRVTEHEAELEVFCNYALALGVRNRARGVA